MTRAGGFWSLVHKNSRLAGEEKRCTKQGRDWEEAARRISQISHEFAVELSCTFPIRARQHTDTTPPHSQVTSEAFATLRHTTAIAASVIDTAQRSAAIERFTQNEEMWMDRRERGGGRSAEPLAGVVRLTEQSSAGACCGVALHWPRALWNRWMTAVQAAKYWAARWHEVTENEAWYAAKTADYGATRAQVSRDYIMAASNLSIVLASACIRHSIVPYCAEHGPIRCGYFGCYAPCVKLIQAEIFHKNSSQECPLIFVVRLND